MMNRDGGILERLLERFPNGVEVVETAVDQPTVTVTDAGVLEVLEYLKHEAGYTLYLDVAAVDWHPATPRFELVYHLYQVEKRARMRVKLRVEEGVPTPSITGLWPGANWAEREAYDLFGISFADHPDLTRIYMPEDWEGHPLRKDYPLRGNRID